MILKRIITVCLFCVSIHLIQAQDTLFIFTKHDCSVCNQTKQVLSARGVSYLEKNVATPANASKMLSKLAGSGFKGSIYMPVIYMGKKLMHPAYSTDSGLVNVEINAVVDSLVRNYRRGKIAKVDIITKTEIVKNTDQNTTADCEHTTGAVYLIVANYPAEKEAIGAVQILIKNGYTKAGFVFVGEIYRVYLDSYPDFKTASIQLSVEKFKFTDAYLQPVN
jgi:glutaredoxin